MGIKSKGITTGAIVSVMMLVGCSGLVRTDDERPEVDVPDRFFSDASGGHETDATTQEDDAWWERYGDAELSALIEGILGENNDIQVAALRVKRARLQAGIAEDALWIPDFHAGGDASFARYRSLLSMKTKCVISGWFISCQNIYIRRVCSTLRPRVGRRRKALLSCRAMIKPIWCIAILPNIWRRA